MKNVIIISALVLLISACKKMPIRSDMTVALVSIDGVKYVNTNQTIQLNKGSSKVFEFEYSAPQFIKSYKMGFDYAKDQNSFLVEPPAVGSTMGTFKYKMDVNALIVDDIVIKNKVTKVFKITLIDKQGTIKEHSVQVDKNL
jgi:hypothetical protein